MKTCTKCGETKPLEAFCKDASRKDGRGCWCRQCVKAWREANLERERERSRENYWANRDRELKRRRQRAQDHLEEEREVKRRYAQEHREEDRERSRQRRQSPKHEADRAVQRAWYEDNPLYPIWQQMRYRCENPKHKQFKDWGGRGIKVCEEWRDYETFVADIERLIGPRPEGKYPSGRSLWSLDRIDNDGNYEPGNVRWATRREQNLNQRPGRNSLDHVIANMSGPQMWCPLCGTQMALADFAEHRQQQHAA